MTGRPHTLRTERLILRPFRESDRETMIDLLRNEEIKKTYMLPDFASRAEAERLFFRLKELSEREDRFVYAVCLNDRTVGFLNDVETRDGTMELGYVIHPDWQNRGFATEALGAAVEELFRRGYSCVRAGYFEENAASARVMEKCGMSPVPGEEEIEYRGRRHRCLYRELRREVGSATGEEA